jgi:hypothetical protein
LHPSGRPRTARAPRAPREALEPIRFALRGVLLAGTLFPSAALVAQPAAEPAASGGIWWSVSVAAAGARLTCEICDPTRDAGPAVEIAAGRYAAAGVRVGLDGSAWRYEDGDFRETVYTAGVVAEIHPRRNSGLHLIGGLGWSGYRANDVDAPPDDDGFGYDAVRLRLGVGWDLPLTASWVVGNRVTLDASSFGTLHDGEAPIARGVGLSVVRVGIYLRRR